MTLTSREHLTGRGASESLRGRVAPLLERQFLRFNYPTTDTYREWAAHEACFVEEDADMLIAGYTADGEVLLAKYYQTVRLGIEDSSD